MVERSDDVEPQGMDRADLPLAGVAQAGPAHDPGEPLARGDREGARTLADVDRDLAAAKATVTALEEARARLTADIRGGNGTVRLVLVATTPNDDLAWINGAPSGTLWMQTRLGPEQSSDRDTTEAAARALAWPLMLAIGRTQR